MANLANSLNDLGNGLEGLWPLARRTKQSAGLVCPDFDSEYGRHFAHYLFALLPKKETAYL